MQKRMDWLIVLTFWGNHPILGAARVRSGVSRFGKGLAVQINGSLKCSSSASLQDMFLNLVSNHLPRCEKKKSQSGSSSTTFSRFSKREFFGVRNRESPSYRSHHLPEKALGVAPELGPPNAIFASLRVIPAKGHQELAA